MDAVEIAKTVGIVISAVVSIGAALSAITPSPKDDAFFKKAHSLINILGLNVGNAKNEKKGDN
ncbi:hypothetical protein [Maridesulfovibrio bastinii]|uniref:hypothetical protein n=1 Tax=Maridesulfovibrio bastinii TaxID=47157 RepID=UPI000428F23D|nr:hypothetical protein [Maridesulfovibrio bastinii]